MASKPGDLLTFARGELLRQIEGAKVRILLASPFLSVAIAGYVVEAATRSSAAERRLMTALDPRSVRIGVLDPKALLMLQGNGFEIVSRRNLHAKVSVIDSYWGLIGSGNLTNAGLGGTERGNAELGVVLNGTQLDRAAAIFSDWWQDGTPVSRQLIERFDALERLGKIPDDPFPYGQPVESAQTDELRRFLAEDEAMAHPRRYWLKSAYHDPASPDWWHRGWISDSAPLPKYKKGDLIIIYLGARNGGPQLCPAVLRAETIARYDRDWVIRHRDLKAADQWPYVTETTFVADLPVDQGVSLGLIGKTGNSLRRGNCSITREEFEKLARAMCRE